MNLRFRFILMFLTWILTGCGSLPFLATPTTTAPPPTPTFIRTPRPTPTSTLMPSPTPVFAAYPWKHVWFKYTVSSPPEVASQFGLTEEPLLVIYTDGMMIASRGDSKIRTRVLNTREVCSFISRLELLGFYELEEAPPADELNPLYDFGSKYQEVNEGRFATLTVNLTNPKSISFFEPYQKYLARPMRKVMEFVEAYNPGGFVPYQPDRLILFVRSGRAADVEESVRARQWDLETPVLHDLVQVPYAFLEGTQAVNVFALLTKYETPIFIEDDVEYTVTMRLLYPHEIVDVGSVPAATPTEARLPVNCNP